MVKEKVSKGHRSRSGRLRTNLPLVFSSISKKIKSTSHVHWKDTEDLFAFCGPPKQAYIAEVRVKLLWGVNLKFPTNLPKTDRRSHLNVKRSELVQSAVLLILKFPHSIQNVLCINVGANSIKGKSKIRILNEPVLVLLEGAVLDRPENLGPH